MQNQKSHFSQHTDKRLSWWYLGRPGDVRSSRRVRTTRVADSLAGSGSGDAAAVLERGAMAFGAACRPGVARPAASLIAFAALLLDYAQKLWPALECVGWLSPFRYFTPFELVMGDPLPVENLLVLGAIAMTGFTLAYFIISQRDISR